MQKPIFSSAIYVLFGGSGDLVSRYLLPSLYRLWKAGKIPKNFLIMGVGLNLWSNEQYREKILEQMIERGFVKPNDWDEFAQHLEWHYLNIDENDLPGYLELKKRLIDFEQLNGDCKWIYYCSIPPQFFHSVIEYLAQAEMLKEPQKQILALEKPFARNLQEAQHLQEVINRFAQPEQVFCVEHFALKPMAKAMPEFISTHPIMDLFQPENLKKIEIYANESIGVPENRIHFYNACPATLDMHSHLLIPMLSQLIVSLNNRYC